MGKQQTFRGCRSPVSVFFLIRGGFTLIELLVVVTIVLLLAGLSFPVYKTVINKSRGAKCVSNLRQIYLAAESYTSDNDGLSLAGSYLGRSPFWLENLRPYLGASSQWDTSRDHLVRCPSSKPGDLNYWAWGYGMNARPGFRGVSSSSYDRLYNWGPQSSGWTRPFHSLTITHKSKRLFFSDSREWQVNPPGSDSTLATFPDYHRHGKNVCNVLFYDGHVEPLDPIRLNQALYNPGQE